MKDVEFQSLSLRTTLDGLHQRLHELENLSQNLSHQESTSQFLDTTSDKVDIDMADNISSTRAMLESAVLELSTLERQAEHTKSVFEASIDITSHYGHSFLTTDEIMNNNNDDDDEEEEDDDDDDDDDDEEEVGIGGHSNNGNSHRNDEDIITGNKDVRSSSKAVKKRGTFTHKPVISSTRSSNLRSLKAETGRTERSNKDSIKNSIKRSTKNNLKARGHNNNNNNNIGAPFHNSGTKSTMSSNNFTSSKTLNNAKKKKKKTDEAIEQEISLIARKIRERMSIK